MQQEETYGAAFVRHLKVLGGHTPFNYNDLQQVKAMTQADLADWLRVECEEFSRMVLANTPEAAAAVVHRKRREAANTGSVVSFLELCVDLFAALP